MSKIFITIITFISPYIIIAQDQLYEVTIKHLQGKINTVGAELNFIQIDSNTAFYTSSTLEDNKYRSLIFKTNLKNGEWEEGSYMSLGKFFSSANIHYKKNESILYFSICDKFNNCRIGKKHHENLGIEVLNNVINLPNTTNTQPHITEIESQTVLYFVSNRDGGFGGMDIWFSIIDEFGNYGQPINAGKEINTQFNEVTPFYNSWNGELFYSSDQEKNKSGFDIYKSKGSLNLWEKRKKVPELNSLQDDLYLSFYNKDNGYLSSNRAPSLFQDKENCCNDIFSFNYSAKEDSLISIDSIKKLLPIMLYFHNDDPNSHNFSVTMTNKTYKESYVSYFQKKEEYLAMANNVKKMESFFENKMKKNYNKLESMIHYIKKYLEKGYSLEIQIKGYTSPLHEKTYNLNLSKRRIASFINLINQWHQGVLIPYIENQQLIITKLPFGENRSEKNISDNPKDKNSIYSIDAILERKIEVVSIIKL